MMHVCDVCALVDGDSEEKECVYCEKCKAWLCKSDQSRTDRRARAALVRWKANRPK
jgi:hypothetical protein